MYQSLQGNRVRIAVVLAVAVAIGVFARPVRGLPAVLSGGSTVQSQAEPAFASSSVTVSGNQNEAVVLVQLPAPAPHPVTVNYTTGDGSAKAGVDYVAASGTVTFPAGSRAQEIRVQLLNNKAAKSVQTLSVSLGNGGGTSTKVNVLPPLSPDVAVCVIYD